MSERREQPEDLEVPRDESQQVKGGVAAGDVNGDDAGIVINWAEGDAGRRLPAVQKAPDVTFKRG
jgi:hypothetical protein